MQLSKLNFLSPPHPSYPHLHPLFPPKIQPYAYIDPIIVLLSETHWVDSFPVSVSSYKILQRYRNAYGGGVATLVLKNLFSPSFASIEAVGISLTSASNTPLNIISVYSPPGSIPTQEIDSLFNLADVVVTNTSSGRLNLKATVVKTLSSNLFLLLALFAKTDPIIKATKCPLQKYQLTWLFLQPISLDSLTSFLAFSRGILTTALFSLMSLSTFPNLITKPPAGNSMKKMASVESWSWVFLFFNWNS